MDATLLALIDLGIIDQATAEIITRNSSPVELRTYVERKLLDAFQRGLIRQQSTLLEMVREGDEPDAAFWREEDRRLWQSVADDVREVATETGATFAIRGGDVSMWQRVDESLIAWVERYYTSLDPYDYGSMAALNATTAEQFKDAYIRWQRGEIAYSQGEGLPALINEVAPIFGPNRARTIAITEGTRIIAESRQAAAMANDAVTHMRLFTAADELVCPTCGPLHNQVRPKAQRYYVHPTLGQIEGPPFHVRCRCDETEETAAMLAVSSLNRAPYEFVGELPEKTSK